MDWRVWNLYRDYFYGYTITQSWWQRIKGKFTGKYEITVKAPTAPGSRTYTFTSDYQEIFNAEFVKRKGTHTNARLRRILSRLPKI